MEVIIQNILKNCMECCRKEYPQISANGKQGGRTGRRAPARLLECWDTHGPMKIPVRKTRAGWVETGSKPAHRIRKGIVTVFWRIAVWQVNE